MWQKNNFRYWLFLVLAAAFLNACSETSTDPQGSSDSFLESNESFLAVQDDVETLTDGGVAVDSAYGVFSLGWNQFITPLQQEATTSSHAFAMAYDDLQPIARRPRGSGGLDLGTVSISYSGGTVDLNQRESPRSGFLYALFNHPRNPNPVNIAFIGGTTYDMVISGSDMFLPLTVSLTAPSEAININSHANADTISAGEALTLNWAGGTADDRVMLRIMAHTALRSGPHGRGGKHQPGERPMPHKKPGAIFVSFENNPGSYTVSAEELAALLSDSDGEQISVHLTQVIATEVQHEGKSYITALRTGERLVLSIQ